MSAPEHEIESVIEQNRHPDGTIDPLEATAELALLYREHPEWHDSLKAAANDIQSYKRRHAFKPDIDTDVQPTKTETLEQAGINLRTAERYEELAGGRSGAGDADCWCCDAETLARAHVGSPVYAAFARASG
jgi:hypothetical protein